MAEPTLTISKAEFDSLKAELEKLKNLQFKTEEQKRHEAAMAEHRAQQQATRKKALEAQGANASTLKYVVGPSGAYNNGQTLKHGQIATKKNVAEPGLGAPAKEVAEFLASLPSIEWSAYDPRAPKPEPVPEKKGPLTAAEMNKADAERPKHGVMAPKKSGRPSDNEV